MLRFTKRADYGLMAIHYIAVNDGLGAVSAKKIAEEFQIPPELLAKILQRLAKRRLIVSQNGPKGGYVLARDQDQISLGQGGRALGGPLNNLRRPVQKLQAAISEMLDAMSLAELTADRVPEILSIRG